MENIKKEAYLIVKKEVESLLKSNEINEVENLVERGLTSIMAMKIVSLLKKNQIKIKFSDLMNDPKLKSWQSVIDKSDFINTSKIQINENKESSQNEFKLTDVQYAYFIGRQDNQVLGGIGCHAYLEIIGKDINVDKLGNSWITLQDINPMLKAKFNKNATQQILKESNPREMEIYNFEHLYDNKEVLNNELKKLRNMLSHRKLNIEKGEVAGLAIAILPENKYRIFLDIDLLVADVMSLSIIIDELSRLYKGENILKNSDYTFKNYIEERELDEKTYNEDKSFWKYKIQSKFPLEPPALPLNKNPELIKNVTFSRRKKIVDSSIWSGIKENAAKNKVTPSMVLLTCYAIIIERWTNQDRFAINIPLFNRESTRDEVNNMVADFTNLLLVEWERNNEVFINKVKALSDTLLENAYHSSYSGVEVQREICKIVGKNINIAPIVFACNIDYPVETVQSREALGRVDFMVSQTPQVWLDFQTYVIDDDLILCWDSVNDLFPDKMLDDMFDSFYSLLTSMADNDNWYKICDVLPLNQKLVREKELNDILPLRFTYETLYTRFLSMKDKYAKKEAIIDARTGESLRYDELYAKSIQIASNLISKGVKKGDYVGITLPRGHKQIIGLLGILFAGATYVPIGVNQPSKRREKIYEQIQISYVLTDEQTIEKYHLNNKEITFVDIDDDNIHNKLNEPVKIDSYDTAYIIMTSGTTGIPKGVEIAHNSAVNTINDLNEKYKVNSNDSVIMVSAIDFDLSVYDIFGMLSVGGTIITLDDGNFKEPDFWLDLINKYNVTIWDSVPILFDMLITMAEGKGAYVPLRLVFLSGDWIATTLPGRFYDISKDSIVVGMGGGTEASIWSNYINIPKEIPLSWKSIPYGKALKNQVYRVVDGLGRICPNYVKGELFIGGVGVAKGYRGDEELTNKKFIELDGIRWYKTGDAGRTWNDGTIEFLGRLDNQVKVKGHRIELGEIEDAILRFNQVTKSIVQVVKIGNSNQLVAFIEASDDNCGEKIKSNQKLKDTIEDTRITYEEYSDFLSLQNNLVLETIFTTFECLGIERDRKYSFFEIMEVCQIDAEYTELIKRWISLLVSNNLIINVENKYIFKTNKNNIVLTPKFKLLKEKIIAVLKGKMNSIYAFYDKSSTNNLTNLLRNLTNYEANKDRLVEIIEVILKMKNNSVRILEVGARDANLTQSILELFGDKINEYISIDNSLFFKDEFETIIDKYNNFKFINKRIEEDIYDKVGDKKFDVVIFYNSLHRFNNIEGVFKEVKEILNNDGVLMGSEINRELLLPEISAAILEKGFRTHSKLNIDEPIIPDLREISKVGIYNNYEKIYTDGDKEILKTGYMLFVFKKRKVAINTEDLVAFLKEKIPTYMIPFKFVKMDKLPLNKNQKVDRKALIRYIENLNHDDLELNSKNEYLLNSNNEILNNLIIIFKEIFGSDSINSSSNYFQLGGDSLVATKVISRIKEEFNTQITVGDVFNNPILNDLASILKQNIDEKIVRKEKKTDSIVPDLKNANKPFPMTDVQFAYWMGRSGAYTLGSVSTHCYFELDCKYLDIQLLQKKINEMIAYHPMLRAIILNTGEQQILKDVPMYLIQTTNLIDLDENEKLEILKEIREDMSHQVFDAEKWPLFAIKITKMKNDKSILHISFDNLILDGWGMFHIIDEMSLRYKNQYYVEPQPNITFRDYVLAKKNNFDYNLYEKAKYYWLNRLRDFSVAPKLMLEKDESEIKKQIFKRRQTVYDKDQWDRLKGFARDNNITPTVLLLTAFSLVLRKWAKNKEFSLNLTQFNREQLHADIDKIVGDFTTLTLLEVKIKDNSSFLDNAKILQNQLALDMEYSSYSAIEFQRELRKRDNNFNKSLMPIVFTSGLGINEWNEDNWIGKLIFNISQTPQVWLDHQIIEKDGCLNIFWDSIDELLSKSRMDNMFAEYKNILDNLMRNPEFIFNIITIEDEPKVTIESIDEKDNNYIGNNPNIDCAVYIDNEVEVELQKIWRDILSVNNVSNNESFFKLGGDSLKMIQIINQLNKKYNIDITVSEFASNNSIREIGEIIRAKIEEKEIGSI
ncbi:MAG: amino acid adenylation domain-containing protein [Peptostreptococcus sp.]|uniref:non-ribosomal peptide synthetase n=1 Tax=Peptostreptococcus sp. TaxID=1262 RepID=UPI0029085E44|nr:non-ribosomal peptide synthetase [Peptostreptococcus sp.]MDU5350743.1 amino acid adenylation domain-containing protein [Peptostreptococcus sp.]MDU5890363.1 amino acid adenylation domain-containing protein [Peptostreptococcus sp.]